MVQSEWDPKPNRHRTILLLQRNPRDGYYFRGVTLLQTLFRNITSGVARGKGSGPPPLFVKINIVILSKLKRNQGGQVSNIFEETTMEAWTPPFVWGWLCTCSCYRICQEKQKTKRKKKMGRPRKLDKRCTRKLCSVALSHWEMSVLLTQSNHWSPRVVLA